MHTSLLLLAVSQVCGVLAPSPQWNNDYGTALKNAEAAKKPLAVFISSGQEGWNKLSKDGQLDDESRKLLAEQYVCLYIDTSEPKGKDLADSFKANGSPTLVLSDRSRTYIALRHEGALDNGQLAQVLERYTKEEPVIRPSYYPVTQPAGRFCPT